MSKFAAGANWYAVKTRSNFERRLTQDLVTKGIHSYCPAYREMSQWADRRKWIERPLFPGYIFAQFEDSGVARLNILNSAGAVRILGTATQIEPIAEREIDWIRRIVESGQPYCPHPFLREGALVRIRRGALKGVEGRLIRIKNQTRLILSIDLLCQAVSTEVESNAVEVIAPGPGGFLDRPPSPASGRPYAPAVASGEIIPA